MPPAPSEVLTRIEATNGENGCPQRCDIWLNTIALATSRGPTMSAVNACRAGLMKTNVIPRKSESTKKIERVSTPATRSSPISARIAAPAPCPSTISHLRLTRSATTPPNGERKNIESPTAKAIVPTAAFVPESCSATMPIVNIIIM